MGRPGEPEAQAADEPLVEEEDEDDEDDDADAGAAEDFVSDDVEEPEDEDDPEPEAFEAEEAGVLLDEEPRLSFR